MTLRPLGTRGVGREKKKKNKKKKITITITKMVSGKLALTG